jgi:hypothetical protein
VEGYSNEPGRAPIPAGYTEGLAKFAQAKTRALPCAAHFMQVLFRWSCGISRILQGNAAYAEQNIPILAHEKVTNSLIEN